MDTEKLTDIVQRSLSERPDNIKLEFVEDIKSFWSQTARATLSWPSGKDSEARDEKGRLRYPPSLFIKLPMVNTNATDIDDTASLESDLKCLWNIEVNFYEVFGNKDLGLFRIPRVYLVENRTTLEDGCFVFEDMGSTDNEVFSEEYVPGFSLDQVKKIVIGLADLHYYCLTDEDQNWRTKCDVPVDVIDNFCSVLWGIASKLKTYDPTGVGKKLDKIQDHYTLNYCYEGRHGYKKSDLNSTNILWTKRKGQKTISAFIDFQMSTVGSICEDMVRVLSLGMGTEDRRKYTDCVLKEYHNRISHLFNGQLPYTFEQVREEYQRVFSSANNFTIFGISCYYGQCKEEKLPADVKHDKLTEYLSRANGIIDDILLL